MRLRVVAGELGGRYLHAPPGRGTRPTPERVREAWFSALGARLAGASVLDLFAGSGALGIEALSRGADRAHFVDAAGRAVAVIRRNLEELGLEGRAKVTRDDVFRFLERAAPGDRAAEAGWNVCLSDPPYRTGTAERLVRRFEARPFAGLLCVEHAPGELDGRPAPWRRRYGDTELSFFEEGDDA